MKILFIGDIVGRAGRQVVKRYLSHHKDDFDLIIANGENSAAGFGITQSVYNEILGCGVTVVTGGNHTFDKRDFKGSIGKLEHFIRPANYKKSTLGKPYVEIELLSNKVLILNLVGRVFMGLADDPFETFDEVYNKFTEHSIIVDFHAEATAEKQAFARYIDGRAIAVLGTHTHVQTNDLRILPKGTLYISDVGMCGAYESILGMGIKESIEKFTTSYNNRFEVVVEGSKIFNAVSFEWNSKIISKKLINVVEDF